LLTNFWLDVQSPAEAGSEIQKQQP